MFNFILRKWKEQTPPLTEVQVYSLVPLYLTQAQADEIVATPKNNA